MKKKIYKNPLVIIMSVPVIMAIAVFSFLKPYIKKQVITDKQTEVAKVSHSLKNKGKTANPICTLDDNKKMVLKKVSTVQLSNTNDEDFFYLSNLPSRAVKENDIRTAELKEKFKTGLSYKVACWRDILKDFDDLYSTGEVSLISSCCGKEML